YLHSRAHIRFTPFPDLTMLFPCARPIYPRASVPFLILEGSIIPRHELPRTMGLLSDADILQYVAKGEIGIEPFDAGNLTPNGYDVSVDEVVVPATEGKPDPNHIPARTRFAVSTRETIRLGRHVAGQIWLRTTWARRGVIASFGIIDAGFTGTLTFGAFNASSEPLELPIGERFAQVVFVTSSRPPRRPTSVAPEPTSTRKASRSGDRDVERGVVFRRRIAAHVVVRETSDEKTGLLGEGFDHVASLGLLCSLQDRVEVDRPLLGEGPEGLGQVVHGRVRQIENHAVHGSDSRQEGARVSLEDRDPFRPIRRDVRPEKSNRDRICVRGDDLPRPATFRDEDRVGADAREGIGDPLAFVHQVGDSVPFRREARTEVGLRQVDAVPESVFPVDRGRPPLSRDRVEFPDSVLAFDAPILEDHLEAGIPPEDRGPDGPTVLLQRFGDFDHRDVSDDIEGTREGGPNGLGNLDDISVAPDCGEPLREVLLRGGESHFDLPSDREQNGLTFRRDSEMLL